MGDHQRIPAVDCFWFCFGFVLGRLQTLRVGVDVETRLGHVVNIVLDARKDEEINLQQKEEEQHGQGQALRVN